MEVVVKGLGVNGVEMEGLPVENEMLIFLVKFLDMLGGVGDVALSYGAPGIPDERVNGLGVVA